MSLKFGTDGVRGVANDELTPELVLALGRAAARVLGTDRPFVVGRDTACLGTPACKPLCTAGLASEGASVVDLGVIPTPRVAHAAAALRAPGAMVSASHNPFADNGIKLFGAGGRKLSDSVQSRVESVLAAVLSGGGSGRPTGAGVGAVARDPSALDDYARSLLDSLDGRTLDGIHVVLDCANGAASVVAPQVFADAGARVTVINAEPDGCNINDDCGSTHPDGLRDAVRAEGADVGLAFDGDADRVLAVDAGGELVDGDQILAVCALDLRSRGRLKDDTLVVTVMANLGLRLAMEEHGVRVVETQVGDRYVLEALEAGRWSLGGEQSGHILFPDLATTGDGLLTGLQLLDVVKRARPAARPTSPSVMTRLPQVLLNVPDVDREALSECAPVWAAVDDAEMPPRAIRPGVAAPVGHGAAGPGDGRGPDPRAGDRCRGRAGRSRARSPRLARSVTPRRRTAPTQPASTCRALRRSASTSCRYFDRSALPQ